ncbi:unnamed protein product [Hermetia illucens]|uniref:Uncharacterized protein n=1 Tax=Hermetia illucens TaxID=343691 RepID=A0A7R8Z0I4_HERIL|nr:unnamed protein product [Hermetia illucens]
MSTRDSLRSSHLKTEPLQLLSHLSTYNFHTTVIEPLNILETTIKPNETQILSDEFLFTFIEIYINKNTSILQIN